MVDHAASDPGSDAHMQERGGVPTSAPAGFGECAERGVVPDRDGKSGGSFWMDARTSTSRQPRVWSWAIRSFWTAPATDRPTARIRDPWASMASWILAPRDRRRVGDCGDVLD